MRKTKSILCKITECLYPEIGFCWICISHHIDRIGYPRINRNYKNQLMKNYLFELQHGKIPAGLCILHHCDNRACINPKHLYLGTQKENVNDMIKRKRDKSLTTDKNGEKGGKAKLTEKQVLEIINQLKQKISMRIIAEKYYVTKSCINHIKRGNSWGYLKKIKKGEKIEIFS